MPVWRGLNRLEHRLRRWRHLARWERQVLIQLAWRLHVVWLQLRIFGFKKTLRFIEADPGPFPAKSVPGESTPWDYARRCAQLVEIAARHGLYRANCLHQSLALFSLLRRTGLPAQLKIGVLPGAEPLQAHAWVELDGKTLGTDTAEYQPFPHLSGVKD
jgi:hypothetical protein